MAATLRQKLTILLLAIYWPVFFLLAHISIPDKIQKAGVSDKCLHFLAYFTLTFLLWFSIKPQTKASLRKASLWIVLAVILLYAVGDEISQGFVGRNCDVRDVVADLVGVITGLVLFSFLSYWPSALILVASIIFGIANVSKANLADVIPVASSSFHLFAYGGFTAILIRYKQLISVHKKPDLGSSALAVGIPIAYLAIVSITSKLLGRTVSPRDTIVSVLGITLAATLYSGTVTLLSKKKRHTPQT